MATRKGAGKVYRPDEVEGLELRNAATILRAPEWNVPFGRFVWCCEDDMMAQVRSMDKAFLRQGVSLCLNS